MQDYDSNGYGGLSYNNPFKPDANSSSLSSSSPVLFADDPWKASNKVNPLLADFDDHDVNTDTLTQKDNPEINSELKASNVLCMFVLIYFYSYSYSKPSQ